MSILYINIAGADIPNTEKQVVVGRPEHAIINKFYFELAKEIVKGVNTPGIGDAKNKRLIIDFEAGHESDFEEITNQWEYVKQALLGENPTGNHTIKLPSEYIKWLAYNSNRVYNEIAKSLSSRGGTVEISIDKIYTNAIGLLVNNIDTTEHYDQFVVNDNLVDDDSKISKDIRKKIGEDVPFAPFDPFTHVDVYPPVEVDGSKGGDGGKVNNQQTDESYMSGKTGGFRSVNKTFDVIYEFREGYAIVKKDGLGGIVDTDLNEILPCKYKSIYHTDGGLFVVENKHGYDLISATGSIVFRGMHDIHPDYYKDIDGFGVFKNDKVGVVDRNGVTLIPIVWDRIGEFYNEKAVAEKNNRWYIIDKRGNSLKGIPDCYEDVGEANAKLIPVKQGGNWGCVDMNFNEIVDFKYDTIKNIGYGLFIVEKDGMRGIMNSDGEELVECQYRNRGWVHREYYYELLLGFDGYATFFNKRQHQLVPGYYKDDYTIGMLVDMGNPHGANEDEDYYPVFLDNDSTALLDSRGNIVLKTEYRKIGVPHEGLIMALYYDNDIAEMYEDDEDFEESDYEKWGMIDISGNQMIPFIYDDLSCPYNGLIVAKFKGENCIINSKNELVFANKVNVNEWEEANRNGWV